MSGIRLSHLKHVSGHGMVSLTNIKPYFKGGENYHLFLVVCFSMEHLLIMQKQCWSSLLLLSWYWFPQIWAFSDTLSVLLTTKNKIFIFHLNFFGSPMCLYHNIFRITLYVSIFVSVTCPCFLTQIALDEMKREL